MLGPHGKEKRWPLGTESSPRLTVSKEVGSSVLQPQGTESGQHLERKPTDFVPMGFLGHKEDECKGKFLREKNSD